MNVYKVDGIHQTLTKTELFGLIGDLEQGEHLMNIRRIA